MLALYRRRQLEWALWRLSTGAKLEHVAPYEFSIRITELLREDIGQSTAKASATSSVYSPLDALLLWVALELISCGLKPGEAAAHARKLRWDLAHALSAKENGAHGETVLLFTKASHNPYGHAVDQHSCLRILALNELQGAVVETCVGRVITVLPVERAAAALSNFLSDAPPMGKSRR